MEILCVYTQEKDTLNNIISLINSNTRVHYFAYSVNALLPSILDLSCYVSEFLDRSLEMINCSLIIVWPPVLEFYIKLCEEFPDLTSGIGDFLLQVQESLLCSINAAKITNVILTGENSVQAQFGNSIGGTPVTIKDITDYIREH